MLRDLGGGLILRRATPADAEPLAAFNADVLRGQDAPAPEPVMAAWTRDLMTGRHPTFRAEDALIVEDTGDKSIVASMILLAHTWTYAGVPLAVGQPEIVGTRREFRARGLVRVMFEVAHAWSATRGDQLLAINGIPWFYRQFGYEMALELGGGPRLATAGLAGLVKQARAPYRLRAATGADAPFLAATSAHAARRYLVFAPRDAAAWRYIVSGRSVDSAARHETRIIESEAGEPAGFLEHVPRVWGPGLHVRELELAPGVSWRAVAFPLLDYLCERGATYAAEAKSEFGLIDFWPLGTAHPIATAVQMTGARRPYAFYLRVPDLPDLLRRLTPVLEGRLAASAVVGHTGELRLSFYRDGVRLVLEAGRIKSVEAWPASRAVAGLDFWLPSSDPRRASAAFPGLTFLHLLLGHRSLAELEAAFPDCQVRGQEARVLLDALFPKQPSKVWPIL
ncbi:MAG TPA: GNAT family N-acetyltransferase [Methylomirabilota bacterium]|nr:GNAT family N-acetyltransferase [Methylomirabilota bacterium]